MSTTSGSPGISALLEPDLPKSHIEQLHLGIDQVLGPHSSPRFLQAIVMLLVELRELAHRLEAVFLRRHLVFLDAVDEESVVRGHAAERSHQDLRDEDRGHRSRNLTPCDLFADRMEMVDDLVFHGLEHLLNLRLPQIRAREPKQAVVLGLEDLLDDGRVHLIVLLK